MLGKSQNLQQTAIDCVHLSNNVLDQKLADVHCGFCFLSLPSSFSISWWAYTFPMTMASIAAILYCHEEAPSWIARGLAIGLSFVSSAAVFILCCLTLLQAFVWRSLFPNDLAIAITVQRPNFCKRKGSPTNEDSNMNSCGGGLYSMHHLG